MRVRRVRSLNEGWNRDNKNVLRVNHSINFVSFLFLLAFPISLLHNGYFLRIPNITEELTSIP